METEWWWFLAGMGCMGLHGRDVLLQDYRRFAGAGCDVDFRTCNRKEKKKEIKT
jgi:hypothetical protein